LLKKAMGRGRGCRNRRHRYGRSGSVMEMDRTGSCCRGMILNRSGTKHVPSHELPAAHRRTAHFRRRPPPGRKELRTGAAGPVCVWIQISLDLILTSRQFFYNTIFVVNLFRSLNRQLTTAQLAGGVQLIIACGRYAPPDRALQSAGGRRLSAPRICREQVCRQRAGCRQCRAEFFPDPDG